MAEITDEVDTSEALDNIVVDVSETMVGIAEESVEHTQYPVGFDPDIHAVGSDGNPILTKSGAFRKRRGSKSKDGSKSEVNISLASVKNAREVSAQASASLLFTLGVVIGGDEWSPIVDKSRKINEPETIKQAFSDYFKATGDVDLPPGLALGVAVIGYALPRLKMPETKSRFSKLKDWVVLKMAKRKK